MDAGTTQSSLRERIEREIREHPVYLVMKGSPDLPRCGFSHAACEALRAAGATRIGFSDALDDLSAYRAALHEITRWPTLPQVFVGGEFVGGADLVREMLATGELREKVLAATG
jgi:monothiol glutaredoxin